MAKNKPDYKFSTFLAREPTPNGAKHYVITDEHRHMVFTMRANGMSVIAIAEVLGVKDETVNRLFRNELRVGYEMVRAKMGAVLVEQGLNGNISAVKFWLANRCPEWRAAREDQLIEAPERDDVVHFYLPPNRRDEPEDYIEPPEIDGEAA